MRWSFLKLPFVAILLNQAASYGNGSSTDEKRIVLQFQVETANGSQKFDCISGNLGKEFPMSKTIEYHLAQVKPSNGCETVQTVPGATAYLIERGGCFFAEKVANVENQAFASLAIVSNDREGKKAITMHQINGKEIKVRIPACMVTFEDGNVLRNMLKSSDTIKITLAHKPLLEIHTPNQLLSKYTPGQDLEIKWTSSHNKPVKIELQQGHSSQAAETWEISNYVPALAEDKGSIPGTYHKVEKTKLRKVTRTDSPTVSQICEDIMDVDICNDTPEADCIWDGYKCASATKTPTISPTSYGDVKETDEDEYEEYLGTEYEYVPGTPIERTFTWKIPTGLPADRFYVVRISYLDQDIFQDSEYFTINGESSFTVTNPSTRGIIMYLGDTYTSTWTTELDDSEAPDEADFITLSLMSYSFESKTLEKVSELTPKPIANTGEYTFTVPTDLPVHGNYYIRLDNEKHTMFSFGNYFFRIDKAAVFVTPSEFQRSRDSLRLGEDVEINWDSMGVLESVDIELVKDDDLNFKYTIAEGVSNSGSFSWTVPDDYYAGVGYRFKVSDPLDPKHRITGQSETPFAISNAKYSVAITSPTPEKLGGVVLFTNQNIQLTWSVEGELAPDDTVDIVVKSSDNTFESIIAHAVATSLKSYNWRIPARFIAGGAERHVSFGLISQANGIREISPHTFRVARSTFHLLPTLDTDKVSRRDRDPEKNAWLDPVDRSFSLSWSIFGHIDYVFISFKCWPVAGTHHPQTKLVMKSSGIVEPLGSDEHPGSSDYFETHAIPTNVNGESYVKGWLPQEIPVNGALYRLAMQCSVRVENARDIQVRDDIAGVGIGPARSHKEWVQLKRESKKVAESSGWDKYYHQGTDTEFFYNPGSGSVQYDPPPAFRQQVDGTLTEIPIQSDQSIPSFFYIGIGMLLVAIAIAILFKHAPGLGLILSRPCRMCMNRFTSTGTEPRYAREATRRPSIIAGLLGRRKSSTDESRMPSEFPGGDSQSRFSMSSEDEETQGLQMTQMSWNQDWSTIAMEETSSQRVDVSLPEPPAVPPGLF